MAVRNHADTPWDGDWRTRLGFFLGEHGYATLDVFLRQHPAVGYVDLARLASEANVAAMQLYGEQLRIAASNGCVRDAARDALPRFLNQYIKRGWGRGKHFHSRLAAALAAWEVAVLTYSATLDSIELKARLRRIADELERSQPAEGWRPTSADDPLISGAFTAGWPSA